MYKPKGPIQVQVIAREWHRCVLRLPGPIWSDVEYCVEPDGVEVVRVNGHVVRASEEGAAPKRRFDFSIPVFPVGSVTARLDVRTGRVFDGFAVRLTIHDRIVYEDRAYGRLDRLQRVRKLPLPSAAPPPDPASLPLPGPTAEIGE